MATQPGQIKTPNMQDTLANLGQNRRMVLVGAGVITVVIALIIIAFVWTRGTSKGGEIELVKRIDQDRAFEVISKLRSEDIEGKLSDSDLPGKVNVTVFQKDFDKAALAISKSDLLQEDGFNLFDKSDWAASDYDKRIKMMRAVNGDLSRIVSRMSGIKWATVRVNIPEPQLFSQYQAQTTATVQAELKEDSARLTRTQVKSVINLLIGYVPNLQKNNISIIDTNGQTYSSVETEELAASEILEETEKVNKIIQKRIEEYLEPLLGYNNYIVRVSSEISRKKIEESTTTFGKGAIGQEQIGDERLGGPGAEDTSVGPALPGVDGSKGYTRLNKVTQNYPSYKQKNVTTPPGRIAKISVAVAINRGLPAGISLKQLREGIAAITSPTTIVEDVRLTVAEFASNVPKQKIKKPSFVVPTLPDVGSFFSNMVEFFKKLPLWASISISILGLIIVLNSFRRPQAVPQQSTVSQINQRMQKQLQKPEEQITAERVPEIPQKEPDFTGILTGLKEAAVEKPEFLAGKLQIWLEEGTAAGRV